MPTINDRALVAADPATSPDRLRELASDASPKIRRAVSWNPSTPTEVLGVLVQDAKWGVRFAVAENPTPGAVEIAVGAADPDVRGRASQRGDLDAPTTQRLVRDPVYTVRVRMSEVTSDPDVVAALARDPHPAVRSSVVLNPALSDADLEMLSGDSIARVRATAAGCRRLRPELLTPMATDRSALVRWSLLVDNPHRLDLARRLADDPDEEIADRARTQLANPRLYTAFLGDVDLVT